MADSLTVTDQRPRLGSRARLALAAIALVALVALAPFLPAPLVDVPASLVLPLSAAVGAALEWFAREAGFGGATVADVTRALAALAEAPIDALRVVLADGWVTGAGFNQTVVAPPASWLGITLVVALLAWRVAGRGLAALSLAAGLYLAVFGLWTSAMTTLASVLLCVVTALALGLVIGIWSYRMPRAEAGIRAVMNVMQTVPIFSYLLPTLLLFGYGPSAALFATVVYALPPMVHATVLALRAVPQETLDLARITGCTRLQTLLKVELPVAVPKLAIGLNQVVMMTLNMVIIASMIGAGGLGYDVLRALRRLDFGAGLEAGMGIVALAVVLDRLTQALAHNRSVGRHGTWRRSDTALAAALVAGTTALGFLVPAVGHWPDAWTVSTAAFWNDAVSFISREFYGPLEAVRTFVLLEVMLPLRDAMLGLPWVVLVGIVALAGQALGGARTALTVAALCLFIALAGFWDAAMQSVYLIVLASGIALVFGMPFGIWVAGRPRAHEGVRFLLDTLQTLPTLVYLLPAVMLFRNGDFSALIAVVSYAIAPAVRYGMAAMSHCPPERVEAARMAGCTSWQTFRHVRLPAAVPTLLLGVNQTLMMALSMLVIAALVGTRELGQDVYTALARGETGTGIVAGLCVAAIALTFDALLKAAAAAAGRRHPSHD